MLQVTREMIRKLASSETVYYRGMRYYATHAVSNVTWSGTTHQYRALVRGSNQYIVTVDVKEDGEFSCGCNCPAYVKYEGACKHIVAVLLFISDYHEREEAKSNFSPEDRQAYQIIEYFSKGEYKQAKQEIYSLQAKLTIPSIMDYGSGNAYLSFFAGNSRMYRITNLRKFLGDYEKRVPIRLGKEFCLRYGESRFDEESTILLSYLLEIYEIQENIGKSYYSNMFNRADLVLTCNMLKKVLSIMDGKKLSLELYGKEYGEIKVKCGNPAFQIDLQVEEEKISLRDLTEERIIPILKDGSVMYQDHKLYLPDREFIWTMLPFYADMEENGQQELIFRKDNMSRFLEVVLPEMRKNLSVSIPESLKDKYIMEPLQPKLYLDTEKKRNKKCIRASVIFAYGNYEINPLNPRDKQKTVVILRDEEKERSLLNMLEEHHFKVSGDGFSLREEEDIYSFLKEGLKLLSQTFTVYYSGEFKGLSLRQLDRGNAGIRLSADEKLLEMELSYEDIPREELEELFKSIRLKKKYHRLRNGSFLELQEQENGVFLQQVRNILAQSTSLEAGVLQFQPNMAFYLDDVFSGQSAMAFEREESFRRLVDSVKYPDCFDNKVPHMPGTKLRNYQKIGYCWLQSLSKASMGGVLADDMGLGKTLQAIVYIYANPGKKHLIVCPTSLVFNWEEEFEKFAPSIKIRLIIGTPEERKDILSRVEEADVFITSYPLIRKDIENYKNLLFDTMFIDEAQYIKNAASLSAKAVKAVPSIHRFALTGTPIENALSELWSVFDFIMPGYLPRYRKFMEVYEKPIVRDSDRGALEDLAMRIQPFILRRLKKDVLQELPDKIETKITVAMTTKQEKLYQAYLLRTRKEMQEIVGVKPDGGRIEILAALTRLRQICCHPATFVENYHGGSGKLELLLELLEDLLKGGHRVLIFSQFTSMLTLIRETLIEAGIDTFYLEGATKPAERNKMVKRFNEGEKAVFLISLKAGGTGLNLTGADTVIHFDPWWNPAVEEQATDRAHRIGQRKSVQVFKLVTKGTIEEKIYLLQKKKKQLSDAVIQSQEVFLNQLTREELLSLFA